MTVKAFALGAMLTLGLFTSSAMAQSNSLGNAPSIGVIERISIDEMASYLQAGGMTVERATRSDGKMFLGVTTPAGGKFIVDMRACQDDVQLIGCELIETLILFSKNNVTLNKINNYHEKEAAVSIAILYPQTVILSQKMILHGGITKAHSDFRFNLFFHDAEAFQRATLIGGGVEVNYQETDFPALAVAAEMSAKEMNEPSPWPVDLINEDGAVFSSDEIALEGFVD